MARSTEAQLELRIATLYEMIVKGCSRAYILRFTAEQWELESRQTDTYLAIVSERIQNTYGIDYKKTILSNHLAQLEDLYAKNYTIEDFRECRNIIESRNKLLGLNEVTKSEVVLTTRNIINLGSGIDPEK